MTDRATYEAEACMWDDRFAARMSRFKRSPTNAITQKARELKAAGRDVVALGSGEPDFDTPDHIKDAAKAAMDRGDTKYTTVDGMPELKAAIQAKLKRENGLDYDISQITVGTGGKQVIFNALMTTVGLGDEVIIPAPYWVSYPDMTRLAGGTPVIVPTRQDRGYVLAAEDLERAITPRTKWLILNNPSNPSGAVYDQDSLCDIADVLLRHPHVLLLSDDIYEHLVYDNAIFRTMASIEPALHDRILTVNGVSKAYCMTGWRIGYGGGPKPLIRAMSKLQTQCTSCPNAIAQWAAVAALEGPTDFLETNRRAFLARRDLVLPRLNRIPGLTCVTPRGAFYLFVDCSGVLGRKTPSGAAIETDTDLARFLLEEHNVALVPGSAFGLAPHLRLSYAASDDALNTACDRIEAALAELV